MTSIEGHGTEVVCHLPIAQLDAAPDPTRAALPSSLRAAGE